MSTKTTRLIRDGDKRTVCRRACVREIVRTCVTTLEMILQNEIKSMQLHQNWTDDVISQSACVRACVRESVRVCVRA